MRLFVAVDLDDASREAIGAEQTRLRRALDAEGRPA
jgi:2'-5' RNA ligase